MKRRLLASLLMVMMLMSLTACGGGASNSAAGGDKWASEDMATEESYVSHSMAETPKEPLEMGYSEDVFYDEVAVEEAEDDSSTVEVTGQKLIRTARLELESTSFDEAALGLETLTEKYGGYFENSSVANYKDGARWGEYVVRIPAEQFEAFLSQAGTLCHLTWQEVTQDDISESYYDTAGRLKTQQIKLERLQELLSKAEAMEDIITLESAISETEWMIEDLSGTLRHYDGKVNYATVHINLREVYKLSAVEEVPDTFGQRMSAAFADGLRNCGDMLEDLAVALAYSWMWWMLLAVIIAVVICAVRKRGGMKWRLRKKKDDKQNEI